MKRFTRRGFTVIELLIVIAIVAVLTVFVAYNALDFAATAKARVVVNNLRAFKIAVNQWVTKHRDLIMQSTASGKKNYGICAKYNTYTENGVTYAYLTPMPYKDGGLDGGWSPIQEWWENREGASKANRPLFKSMILGMIERQDESIKVSGGDWASSQHIAPAVYDGYMLNDNDSKTGAQQDRTAWFVGYRIPNDYMGKMVKTRLTEMAKREGLLSDKALGSKSYSGGDNVWMLMLNFESN